MRNIAVADLDGFGHFVGKSAQPGTEYYRYGGTQECVTENESCGLFGLLEGISRRFTALWSHCHWLVLAAPSSRASPKSFANFNSNVILPRQSSIEVTRAT